MIRREVIFVNDNHCKIDDINFQVETGQNLYSGSSANENSFIIGKSRRMLETLIGLDFKSPVKNICDLGIYKGGSVVFYYKLFSPQKIIAFDLNKDPEPVASLSAFIKNNALEKSIRPYYGIDQSDRRVIEGILQTEIDGQHFDLIVDDASHFLAETRESFNILFPKLAPGGYYIIEDWGWAHWDKPQWQDNGGPWRGKPPLSNLIFELTMLLASRPDLVESIFLLPAYAIIKKSVHSKSLPREYFDLSKNYLNRGQKPPWEG